jgi:catechol 2,3-dioxygenase-like lactoylglutathione lyase family enzyme
MTLWGIVLNPPDARELAAFYRQLLGWAIEQDYTEWVKLSPPDGGTVLSFQTDAAYIRPNWPAGPDHQQMMLHLGIGTDDLDAAEAHEVALGAVLADFQPQDDVRIYLDPVGHPFCPFLHR